MRLSSAALATKWLTSTTGCCRRRWQRLSQLAKRSITKSSSSLPCQGAAATVALEQNNTVKCFEYGKLPAYGAARDTEFVSRINMPPKRASASWTRSAFIGRRHSNRERSDITEI
jgi:hypothetical protein